MKKFIAALIATTMISSTTVADDHKNSSMHQEHMKNGIHDAVHNNSFRLEEDSARDKFRHPGKLLHFAGVTKTSTVIEVNPGSGWYTRIIAPLVRDEGQYIGLEGNPKYYSGNYGKRLSAYPEKLKESPEMYGGNAIASWLEAEPSAVKPGSVDVAIAVRTLHNFDRRGYLQSSLAYLHTVIKDGGHFVVVQHRSNEDFDGDHTKTTELGRWKQSEMIAAVEAQGFKFVASDEMNANDKDPQNISVWQLPPSNRMMEENGGKYKDIGESDRMTLKFVKVAK